MSGSGSARRQQRAAEQAEAQRRADIARTQQSVEAIYSTPEREAQIQDLVGATRTFLGQDLDRKNTGTRRQAKFALARSGMTGGSVDVDVNQNIAEDYLRGALEVERRSQAAGNSLRQADQQAKQNLFAMAQSGLDSTTAARQALTGMRVDAANARSEALQQGIGDVFGQFGDIYRQSKESRIRRDQEKQLSGVYAPSPWLSWASGFRGPP